MCIILILLISAFFIHVDTLCEGYLRPLRIYPGTRRNGQDFAAHVLGHLSKYACARQCGCVLRTNFLPAARSPPRSVDAAAKRRMICVARQELHQLSPCFSPTSKRWSRYTHASSLLFDRLANCVVPTRGLFAHDQCHGDGESAMKLILIT